MEGTSEVRHRNVAQTNDSGNEKGDHLMEKEVTVGKSLQLKTGTYWLTRIVLLRAIGFVYAVAFLVALHQNGPLLGKDGLVPADKYLSDIKRRHPGSSKFELFQKVPTLLWFVDYKHEIDAYMSHIALLGFVLSSFVCLFGMANIPVMLLIWILYHSLVNVGQTWYSFGWESQILETGFLAAFLCPLLSVRRVPRKTPTSFIVLLGFRWLIFRIMIGAGLIKIRGDKCWRDLTCMNYHYETQPVPNPIAYYMHQEPEIFHKFEVLSNHFVELVVPFFLFLTRRFRLVGGFIQVLFQVVLIISGNLSFLNWLTIIPSLACFDDASLAWMFSSKRNGAKWRVWQIQQEEEAKKSQPRSWVSRFRLRHILNLSFGILIGYLSVPIVQNLLSSRQIMNTSFDTFRVVNTYGAFGSITKERTEVIFQGTYDYPSDPDAEWFEYEFKCKPGDVKRRPCLISPYHYRLDWLLWFAAFQNYQYNPWLVHMAAKFLVNDLNTTTLIAHNPFEGDDPPRYVRAEHYRYRYTKIGSKQAAEGAWWTRTRIGNYLPPVDMKSLKPILTQMGWQSPKKKTKSGKKKKTKK